MFVKNVWMNLKIHNIYNKKKDPFTLQKALWADFTLSNRPTVQPGQPFLDNKKHTRNSRVPSMFLYYLKKL
jgi:hypothetical protein